MSSAAQESAGVAARTGRQFLDGLRGDARELWLNGVRITHPLDHAELHGAAVSLARVYDLQHEHADEMLAPSPADGRLVNVTHLIPRSREDLERRRRAIEIVASLSGGTMGRTPDYLNVTFACFAGRRNRRQCLRVHGLSCSHIGHSGPGRRRGRLRAIVLPKDSSN